MTKKDLRTSSWLSFLRRTVAADHAGMVSLERLQGHLLSGLELLLLQLLHLSSEHSLGRHSRVDTVRLDGDHEMPSVLQEVVRIDCHNTSLVRLRHIREDNIHHANQHTILQRMPGVLNNRDNIRPLLRHVHQVSSTAMRKLHSVDNPRRTYDVGDMRDGSTRRSSEVEHMSAWFDPNVVHATEDCSRELGPEGVPDTVLGFGSVLVVDRDALLPVHALPRDEILGDERVLLALGDEHALVAVRLDDHLGSALGATAAASSSASAAPAPRRGPAATTTSSSPAASVTAPAPSEAAPAPAASPVAPAAPEAPASSCQWRPHCRQSLYRREALRSRVSKKLARNNCSGVWVEAGAVVRV
jgi:hypothetical protein